MALLDLLADVVGQVRRGHLALMEPLVPMEMLDNRYIL